MAASLCGEPVGEPLGVPKVHAGCPAVNDGRDPLVCMGLQLGPVVVE
jgi:hypothetical protein